jgi:hypothetical protein
VLYKSIWTSTLDSAAPKLRLTDIADTHTYENTLDKNFDMKINKWIGPMSNHHHRHSNLSHEQQTKAHIYLWYLFCFLSWWQKLCRFCQSLHSNINETKLTAAAANKRHNSNNN